MGYFDRADLALLPRAGRRLHRVRPVLLLGVRPDRPQPALLDGRRPSTRTAPVAGRSSTTPCSPGPGPPTPSACRTPASRGGSTTRSTTTTTTCSSTSPSSATCPSRARSTTTRSGTGRPTRSSQDAAPATCPRSAGSSRPRPSRSTPPTPRPLARRTPAAYIGAVLDNPELFAEDGLHPQLRRERRLLRPRAAAHPTAGDRGRVRER